MDGAPRELGDVVICPEHTEDLCEAIVHGVLHLVGMDHERDRRGDAGGAGGAAAVGVAAGEQGCSPGGAHDRGAR